MKFTFYVMLHSYFIYKMIFILQASCSRSTLDPTFANPGDLMDLPVGDVAEPEKWMNPKQVIWKRSEKKVKNSIKKCE